jgi:hypothetical protein
LSGFREQEMVTFDRNSRALLSSFFYQHNWFFLFTAAGIFPFCTQHRLFRYFTLNPGVFMTSQAIDDATN